MYQLCVCQDPGAVREWKQAESGVRTGIYLSGKIYPGITRQAENWFAPYGYAEIQSASVHWTLHNHVGKEI